MRTPLALKAAATIPGIKNMNTGRILRNPAKIAHLRALFRSFAASARCTIC